jgi:hypothetical protein
MPFSRAEERFREREKRLTHLACGEQSPRLGSKNANSRKFLLDMAIFAMARARAIVAQVLTTGDIEAMYVDKLDGRIDADFYDRKAGEFRAEQTGVMSDIDTRRAAMQGYTDKGARLRELAARAAELFEAQPAAEKRKLLDFVVSECWWKGGELETVFREPFGMLIAGLNAAQPAVM